MLDKNSQSNQAKSTHGYETQDLLETKLNEYKDSGYITDLVCEFRIGNPNKNNSKQFYAPFMIQFADRTRWIIYSTTSMRTDRVKGQQWDAYNIKKLDSTITRAFLTYPDDISREEKLKFISQNEKYINNDEESAIDKIVSQNELLFLIAEVSDKIYFDEINAEKDNGKSITQKGQQWDKQGRSFEKEIVDCLSSSENLNNWKKNVPVINNSNYSHFHCLVQAFDLKSDDVEQIIATNERKEIGYLPAGGSPKTDVFVTVLFKDSSHCHFTISCKRSTKDNVSVHQYSADDFADVLDKNNTTLRELLQSFQFFGNLRDFPKESAISLQIQLTPYTKKLGYWVLGGIGGPGEPTKQWANFLVTYKPHLDHFSVHTIKEYYELLIKTSNGAFGTPFQWTFASGQRGKSIQLKCKVL